MSPRDLSDLIHPSWARALEPVAGTITAMGDFLRDEITAGRGYLPAGTNVLRAFTIPLEEVRVLVVGQDPYPTPGHAIGLSFAVAPEVRPLPKSLVNIHRELVDDLGVPPPSNGDLTPWAQQGVMLLNRCLTVTPAAPNSHRGKGWEAVTDRAIEVLAERDGPLVAILWGADARRLAPTLGRERCIESVHPSPLSAYRGFFGSHPFSAANDLLVQQGATPIDWRLP
ncbi:uracil-DNA glycosylase [Janibacter alittae]|uniref:Uracil-DNA glycosylase n=1 Tax=Janibacter alittae TaxID=3115209 RepID=A0ABZ2MID1_9MICO